MSRKRIGLAFSESFSLSRPSVMQVLSIVAQIPQGASLGTVLKERTSLGKNYVKSMPQYAKGSGLLGFNNRLTPFGHYVLAHDPLLEQRGTQWLMHYYMSAPHGPGPAFWHELVCRFFYVGHEFSKTQLERHVTAFVKQAESRELVERTIRSAVTVFVGTYLKPDGLGKLGILSEVSKDCYRVNEVSTPPPTAAACALLDYWAAHFEGRLTISLDTLVAPDGFVRLFMMGRQDLNEVLRALQGEHYVEVYRSVLPEQVVLLQQDIEPLLKKLYGIS